MGVGRGSLVLVIPWGCYFPGEKGPTSIYPEVSWLQDMVGVRVVSPYSLDGCEVRVD